MRDLFAELWQKLKDEECSLQQKSRQQWLLEGDTNTTFFHGCIKSIRRKNQIVALMAKLLAARLRRVLPSIIATNQFAFLSNKYILDSVVIINKVIDYAKKYGKKCMVFKVDFEKAYDSVN